MCVRSVGLAACSIVPKSNRAIWGVRKYYKICKSLVWVLENLTFVVLTFLRYHVYDTLNPGITPLCSTPCVVAWQWLVFGE